MGVSFQTGALVEPFTCGYYAIEANGRTNASETVVVSGGGNIGLCAAARGARGMGARAILVDPLPLRRAAAEKIGVDVTVDPSAGDAVAKVLELTNGKGADLVIEASGHDASLAAVFDYVRIGGRVTFVGISIGRKIPVELGKIQGKSLTIKGTIGSPGVWPAALRFLSRTKLDLSPIQTHFFDLDQGHRSLRIRQESEGMHQGDADQRGVTGRTRARLPSVRDSLVPPRRVREVDEGGADAPPSHFNCGWAFLKLAHRGGRGNLEMSPNKSKPNMGFNRASVGRAQRTRHLAYGHLRRNRVAWCAAIARILLASAPASNHVAVGFTSGTRMRRDEHGSPQ